MNLQNKTMKEQLNDLINRFLWWLCPHTCLRIIRLTRLKNEISRINYKLKMQSNVQIDRFPDYRALGRLGREYNELKFFWMGFL